MLLFTLNLEGAAPEPTPAPTAAPIQLLGGGPGKPRKQYDKDSYMARLLAPPIEFEPEPEIETGVIEVVPEAQKPKTAKPRRDDSAEIRAAYREAAQEIAERKRRQREQEDEEAVAIFAAFL